MHGVVPIGRSGTTTARSSGRSAAILRQYLRTAESCGEVKAELAHLACDVEDLWPARSLSALLALLDDASSR